MSTPIRETGPINAPLPGLLDLFSLKTFGANPTDLSQLISNIYDVGPHIYAGKAEYIANSPTPQNGGSGVLLANPLVIPNGETWMVDMCGLFVTQGGGGVAGNWAVQVRDPNSTTGIANGVQLLGLGVNTSAAAGLILPRTIYTAGTSFRVLQWSATGAAFLVNPTVELELRLVRLKA